MKNNVSWTIDAKIKDLDALQKSLAIMVPETREKEPGALAYEWWISEDKSTLHLYERYADSAAVMAHMGNVGPHLPAFLSALELRKLTMYGPASDDVRSAFADFGPTYMTELGGFTR